MNGIIMRIRMRICLRALEDIWYDNNDTVAGEAALGFSDTKAKLKVLKSDETRERLLRTKEEDIQAREELIAGNLRLVLSVIQRFANRGENADDLFQVGCIGLIKAIDNFNTDLDVKFSTYGVPMIVGEIRRYLRDNSTMRVSRSMRDTAYKVLQAKEAYMAQHQKEPSVY